MYTSRKSPKRLDFSLRYEATDMKLIAKESRLSVGTLYNYYSKK
nr:TetR family transcriptional regulator [Clostridium botulinum]